MEMEVVWCVCVFGFKKVVLVLLCVVRSVMVLFVFVT